MFMFSERKKIILVDDTPIVLKLARNTLMGRYDVFTMPSGKKLFGLLEEITPDLILLDVMMPEINGYEVIRRLKSSPDTARIPVIFLTSKSDADSEIEGLSLGAVDYIVKPFSPQLLLKRVDLQIQLEEQKRHLKKLNNNLQQMVDEKTESVLELQNALLKTIGNLVEFRDDVTGSHVERTGRLLAILLDEMTRCCVYSDITQAWDKPLFLQSAQLHDVGKIAIRDCILQKPGKLTPEEFDEMKMHTTFGEKIILKIQHDSRESAFLTHAGIMAGTHHEKWNGMGYPRGLSEDDIPLEGRMMAIVDVYDALVSERPYKKAFSHEDALEIIAEESGRQFDPLLAGVFLGASDKIAPNCHPIFETAF
ncbi:MAG: response regulator [Synergistaceae bacterium]|jgi:putative two-component system response regulator|nr:response regulator [Synergistaceae bacterium]